MGNTQNKENMTTDTESPRFSEIACQNVNMNFIKDNKPVYACPGAVLSGKECGCGNRCIKDNTGMCCQSIEQIKGKDGKYQQQCIENILNPEYKWKNADVLERKILYPPQPYNSSDNPFSSSNPYKPAVVKPTPNKRTRVAWAPSYIKYEPCNMADVSYKNTIIPGQQLCDWMNPNSNTFAYGNVKVPMEQVSKWYNNPKIYY